MPIVVLPRLLARLVFVLCVSLAATPVLTAQSSVALDGFNPDVDGNVFALATLPDGKLLVAGQFSTVGGVPRNHLARLNADGSVDVAFDPNPDGPVRALLVQSDGRIVIGGDFTALQPNASGAAVPRGRLARLNADGALDATFAPMVGGEPIPGGGTLRAQVFALAQQADGSILVGGSFGSVQPGMLTVIFPRRNLLRLTSAGGVDQGFDPRPNATVLALAMHADSKILVGGGFTELQPNGGAVTTRNRIARLNANGTIDSEFNPNANNGVAAIAVQRDGKIVLGGFFTALQPIGEENSAARSHLARLNPNGTLDSEFISRAEGNVAALAIQPDGGILVGGAFNAVWGRGTASVSRSFVARFNSDGSVDTGFAPTLNAQVDAFAFQADGKIVVGGHFTRALPRGGTTAVVRNHLARLNPDGSLDTHFQLDPGGRTLVSLTQSDGRIVIGGTFTSVGGATHNYLARLNADGSVDSTYGPSLNGPVYALAYEAATNKVIVGGDFTTIGGETRNRIARLNANGTIDSEFNPNIDGRVGAIVVQSDGRILVGGSFSSVNPIGAAAATNRSSLLRLNANGTLDTAFDPSPNSSVSAIAVQPDGKILIGGLFSALIPGAGNPTATGLSPSGRSFLARLNADGTVDTAFNTNANGQVSAIVVQPDSKIVIAGAFTGLVPNAATEITTRNRIARLNADGTVDTAFDPNASGNVLAVALQSDGKLVIGGTFTTLQPNGRATGILRKYAARLNSDGTVDEAFNLDINEQAGNRVDSLRVQPDGRILIGGAFTSLHPGNDSHRTTRPNFVRLNANGSIDLAFDPGAGGSTSAIVKGLAVQADGRIVAVGSFTDLGGAKSTNIARFRPEGTVDPDFSSSVSVDGTVNAVVIRPNAAPVATQLAGFAWLNANGTLRSSFAPSVRLSGEVTAIAVDAEGRLLLGGVFANLDNSSAANLVRFNANGTLDTSFAPNPNGQVTGIVVQPDGRIVIVGAFTTVGGTVRNRIARIDSNGSLDVTYDPNANGRINAVVLEGNGGIIVGGNFTSFTPNLTTTAVTRNFLARVNPDGTIDANYNPSPNANVNALGLQSDGKVIAGGSFTSVAPGNAPTTRNGLVRLNADGTLDQNFDPNASGPVNAIVVLPNGQLVVGGAFTTLQPRGTGPVFARTNLARVNSDGAVDESFNPSPNGTVTRLALQSDGSILVGGAFSALRPTATGAAVTRNRIARIGASGALDLNFNPDVNGSVSALAARPDGSVLVGGNFTDLRLIGSIVLGGAFPTIGGVPAQNLAMLNDNGSVNTTFQPRPDGAVHALLALPDGRVIVGGAFANIAGTARRAIARFTTEGAFDATFAPSTAPAVVTALALQPDGRVLVGGSAGGVVRLNADGSADATFTALPNDGAAGDSPAIRGIAVQADGSVLVLSNTLRRYSATGTPDASIALMPSPGFRAMTLQADGGIIVASGTSIATVGGTSGGGTQGRPYLARVLPGGGLDASFNPAPNGPVDALALQPDGRLVIGGGFTRVADQTRVGIARIAATSPATQMLGVAANRSSVTWTRGGSTGELAAVIFEVSTDRVNWTRLGEGTRVASTSHWQLAGLNLPASGLFYIRARGLAPTSAGTSSGIYEMIREFNYANPVAPAAQSTTPAAAASPVVTFDPFTGIAVRATIRAVAGEGTVEILAANSPSGLVGGLARLANLSTRGRVTAQSPLLLGFAIAGTESRRVLVRAVGPALTSFGVTDALPATRLQVYNSAGAVIASNEGWANATELAQTAAATGAFPLTAGSADSAAVLSLAPGTYTIEIVDTRGNGGVALAEIYDAGTGAGSRLVNVSSRGTAGAGSAALISGFVIAGNAPQRVLLRGVGPGLARFAAGAVTDPAIAVYDAEGRELGGNDNWVSSVNDISVAASRAGAFGLDTGSKDAAVLATLPPGAYTTQVSATATGTALLEIYDVR